MLPANAPLPTTCSFPFHPLAGSQTSALMSDCGVGFSVTATRQNAGSAAKGFGGGVAGALAAAFGAPPRPPAPPPRAGWVNPPGATVCASVTVVVAFVSDVRLSQVAASAGSDRHNSAPANTTATTTFRLHFEFCMLNYCAAVARHSKFAPSSTLPEPL